MSASSSSEQQPPLKRARTDEAPSTPENQHFSISTDGPRGFALSQADLDEMQQMRQGGAKSPFPVTIGAEGTVQHQLLGSAGATVSVIGAGYIGGQPIRGVEHGPKYMRAAGLIEDIAKLGWRVKDHGDLKFDSSLLGTDRDPPITGASCTDESSSAELKLASLKNCRTVGGACKLIRDKAFQCASRKEFVLTLGGDHSLAMGSITGVADAWGRNDLRVIWVDAHGDINTPSTTPSGNLHGMPVAFLLNMIRGDDVPGFEWMSGSGDNPPVLSADRIVFVGLRDVDPGEKRNLQAMGITCFSMKEVDKYGIGQTMEMAIKIVDPTGKAPIHLSYDIDGIDPAEIPATGTKVKGGLTYREAMFICETVADTGRLVSMDIVELNPSIGDANGVQMSAQTSVALARSALGQTLL